MHSIGATFLRESAKPELEAPPNPARCRRRRRPRAMAAPPPPVRLDIRLDGARLKLAELPPPARVDKIVVGGPVQSDRPRRHAQPREDFRLPSGQRRARKSPAPARFSRISAAAPSAVRSPTPISGRCSRSTRAGAPKAISTTASRRRSARCWSPRASFSASSATPPMPRPARSTASTISSWRRGSRSSSGAASPTTSCSTSPARASLKDRAVLQQQVRRMLDDPRSDALVSNFAGQWLYLRNLDVVEARSGRVPRIRRQPARGLPQRDRAVLREHPARGPQRPRPARRELHVPESAARRALRHPERLRLAVPQGDAHRPESRRHPRTGQRPDRDFVPEPHLGRAARQVDSRNAARHAAPAASARCPGAEAARQGWPPAHDAPADGGASRQSRLRLLPLAHGSARLRARELRRRRQVAHERCRRRDRRLRQAARRRDVSRPRRPEEDSASPNAATSS